MGTLLHPFIGRNIGSKMYVPYTPYYLSLGAANILVKMFRYLRTVLPPSWGYILLGSTILLGP